jgi:hypothetical protein
MQISLNTTTLVSKKTIRNHDLYVLISMSTIKYDEVFDGECFMESMVEDPLPQSHQVILVQR